MTASQELSALLAEYHLYRGNEVVRFAMHDAVVALYVANKITREEYRAAMAYL